jgi:hypothetical protein
MVRSSAYAARQRKSDWDRIKIGQLKNRPADPAARGAQSAAAACKSDPLRSFPRLITIATPTKAIEAIAASAAPYDICSAINASTKAVHRLYTPTRELSREFATRPLRLNER